ncbi:11750_t:CDS:2 [Funneliformis geosporum]|uniref:Methionine aminopeptidase n=1 Tax=Funneliformis geosporum TaxID=1117311 RepID=A0A9W4SND1_9GLOM|nr:11750_t:CDS:2 [Funneliformis geosporum]CAI2174577.1 14669_t:CDS:2 [Funneliformis geosporum]
MNGLQRCQGAGCTESANLQCPTCLNLKIPGSFFCSRDCFRANWSTHKHIHEKTYIPKFSYTGTLRAVYPLSPKRQVPQHIERPDYADNPSGVSKSEQVAKVNAPIKVLNEAEIEGMRKVCKLAREVLDIGAATIKPGVTTDEIDRVIHDAIIERDSYPSPLNYYEFPKSVCTSVNEVICHGIPDQRELLEGDIINLDVTLYHNGFHGDLNETYPVGNIDDESKKLIRTAKECLDKAVECVKPGFLYRNLGTVIEKHAKANSCSVVQNKAIGTMKPGQCFTIEPMINLGTWRDRHWTDNWTAVTDDGKRSAQFEHTLLVTKKGVEILTAGKNE